MSYSPITLASGSASSAATLDIDMSAYYNLYTIIEVILYGLVPVTTNTDLQMLVSADGSTFDNASGNYKVNFIYNLDGGTSGGGGSTSATSMLLTSAVGNTVLNNNNYRINIINPGSASFFPTISYSFSYVNNGGGYLTGTGGGWRVAAQITKAVRFKMSSGNITTSYIVRGIK